MPGTVLSMAVEPSFDLEKVVCSHGFFMMAPNQWLSSLRTLHRHLRLTDGSSVGVCISQSEPSSPNSLKISVSSDAFLSESDKEHIMRQVRRMFRITLEEEARIAGFHTLHPPAKEKGFGRVFRSPTLFEDMVKCMLLCNCQWPRTLSMVRALCDLQMELKGGPAGSDTDLLQGNEEPCKIEVLSPETPACKEPRRKHKRRCHKNTKTNCKSLGKEFQVSEPTSSGVEQLNVEEVFINGYKYDLLMPDNGCSASQPCNDSSMNVVGPSDCLLTMGEDLRFCYKTGNFPSPEELYHLNEKSLNARCKLGYRAGRIIKLAKCVVEKILLLDSLDGANVGDLTQYEDLEKQLKGTEGFGPFTRANVLMCMGFYHKVPADSETLRHIKQFHRKTECTPKTLQKYVDDIYDRYAPYQFLAYWFEIWGFYEEWFGKLNEMPPSQYHLITASNMKTSKRKRKQIAIAPTY